MAKFVFAQNLWSEYFGTMSLAATLKRAGHQATVVMDRWSRDRLVKGILDQNPTVACFSCLTGSYGWCLDVARGLKEVRPQLPILFGGIHATLCPEMAAEPAIDAVCMGEADEAIVDVGNALDAHQGLEDIPNLCVSVDGEIRQNEVRPLIQDLDSLPFPDRSIYLGYPYFQGHQIIQMMTGRGCPYRCSFCHNHFQQKMYRHKGRYVRQRSVDSVIEEIKEIRDRFPLRRAVAFNDDVLWVNLDWLFQFLDRYAREIRLPFGCTITPRRVNEDVVKALKEAGIVITGLACETGDEEIRRKVLRKPVANEEYLQTASLLRKYGIPFTTGTILALPGEDFNQALRSLELNWQLRPIFPWSSLFQPYPGIDLTQWAEDQGFIAPGAYVHIGESFYNKSLLDQPDRDRLANLQKLYFLSVRFPWAFPAIRALTKLPPNPLFTFIFLAGYVYYLMTVQKLTFRQILTHSVRFALSGFRYRGAEKRNLRSSAACPNPSRSRKP